RRLQHGTGVEGAEKGPFVDFHNSHRKHLQCPLSSRPHCRLQTARLYFPTASTPPAQRPRRPCIGAPSNESDPPRLIRKLLAASACRRGLLGHQRRYWAMTTPASSECTGNEYTLRRLQPADAPGVARLVEAVYGDSYYPRDLYDPEQIVHLNEAGKLVSVVALDGAGRVVGHYALERPRLTKVAEASDAIVLPEHRHHH